MKNKILINILLIIGIIVFSNTLVKAEDKLDNVDMTLDKISIIGDTTTFSEKDKIYFDIKTTGDVKFISLAFNYENLDNESTGLLLHAQKENDKYYISLSDIQTSGTLKLYEGTYNLDFVYLCSDAGGGSTENNYIFYSKDTSSIEDHRKLNDDISFTVKNSITLDKISIIGDTTTFSEKDKIYLNIKANEEIKEMFLEIVDDTNDNVFNAQVLDVNNEPYIDLSKLELAEGQYSVNMVTLTSKYISSYKIYSKENNEQIITEDLKDDIKFSVVKNNSKNENAITENTTKNQIDNTVSKQKLPKAGKTTMVVAILVSILLSNILYICYKKYKRIN